MAAAALAAEPDVGAEPVDQPRVLAARMAGAEADDIAEEERQDGGSGHRPAGYQSRGVPWPVRGSASSPAARAGRPA